MSIKKAVTRRLAALLAASVVLTGSAFTSLAAVNSSKAGVETGESVDSTVDFATPGDAATPGNAEDVETATPSNIEEVPKEFREEMKNQMKAIDEELGALSGTEIDSVSSGDFAGALPEGVTDVKLILEKATAKKTEVELTKENGEVTGIRVVVKQVVYEIKLVDNATEKKVELNGSKTVSVAVSLPSSISEKDNTAKIRHDKGEDEWENLPDSSINRTAEVPTAVIRTTSFSPFELTFAYEDSKTNTGNYRGGGGGGGSRSTSASGSWQKNEIGWWFQYTNGGYAANKWESINGKWYYFNESGYAVTGWQLINGQWYFLDTTNCDMQTGWHLDSVDGKWYYLSASGAMVTGWAEVNSKFYYLSPAVAEPTYSYDAATGLWVYTKAGTRPFGSMYASETTPDGYQVDVNGAWIQ